MGIMAAVAGFLALPAAGQVQIPETHALPTNAGNAAQPGFIWNVFQNEADQRNSNQKTEEALAGLLRDAEGNPLPNNAADYEVGGADDAGVKLGTADNALIQFVVSTIINFNQDLTSSGNIPDDLGIPGIPGVTGSTDGIAAEALTWLSLPAGDHTLIVNSDDGFRLNIGGAAPSDATATFVGEFNGGRGASDTIMNIRVTKAGVYAARLTWQEGGGGANVEFVQVLPSGTRVAVNSAESTIKAFRSVTGTIPTFVRSATPTPGGNTAPFNTPIRIELDGAGVVANTVKLSLDGTEVAATVSKTGNITTINYQPPGRFAPRSQHTVSVAFNDGQARTLSWNFGVTDYALLTSNLAVTADTSKPGFIWNVHQNSAFQANDNTRPEQQLAGLLGENFADRDAVYNAVGAGVAGANNRMPIRFEIPGVINFSQAEGESNGEFPDEGMPGIPGLQEAGPTDGIAAEILTFIELPAGVHTMIVNSDDGFRTTAGNVRDIFQAQLGGQFVGGRGAADTLFDIVVETAGVYPFRTIWYEGGGGANIEWKTVKSDATRALVNDVDNGGFKAYRATTSPNLTAITRVSPAINNAETAPGANIEVIIEEGNTTVDVGTVQLSLNGSPVNATVTKNGTLVTVSYDPPADFPSPSTQTATIAFTAGTPRSESWSFSIPPVTRDKTTGKVGFVLNGAVWTADAGGRTAAAGDYGMDLPVSPAGIVSVPDGTFLNTATGDDTLTVSYWQKLHAVRDSSAFWLVSPSSPSDSRGMQAHTPWGDQSIYFDNSGCCNADETRISAPIANFEDYTGTAAWWQTWHHFALVKNAETKEIWINGKLFHSGIGNPLPSDFTRLTIGGGPGITQNRMAGVLDDFAIYNAALTPAQIAALASGTAPGAVTGSPGLIAHWDFNDPPASTGPDPEVSVAKSGANVVITYTGVLQGADAVNGPYSDVAGATSPATIPASAAQKYYRSRSGN